MGFSFGASGGTGVAGVVAAIAAAVSCLGSGGANMPALTLGGGEAVSAFTPAAERGVENHGTEVMAAKDAPTGPSI